MLRLVKIISMAGLLGAASVGCNSSSLSPVDGKIVLADSDFQFSGDTLEIRSGGSPSEVGYAEIKPDGSFSIESLQQGRIVPGANPGEYQARIVVADDHAEHKKEALKSIPKKYLEFETSGLSLNAPSRNVTLTITK